MTYIFFTYPLSKYPEKLEKILRSWQSIKVNSHGRYSYSDVLLHNRKPWLRIETRIPRNGIHHGLCKATDNPTNIDPAQVTLDFWPSQNSGSNNCSPGWDTIPTEHQQIITALLAQGFTLIPITINSNWCQATLYKEVTFYCSSCREYKQSCKIHGLDPDSTTAYITLHWFNVDINHLPECWRRNTGQYIYEIQCRGYQEILYPNWYNSSSYKSSSRLIF